MKDWAKKRTYPTCHFNCFRHFRMKERKKNEEQRKKENNYFMFSMRENIIEAAIVFGRRFVNAECVAVVAGASISLVRDFSRAFETFC
ncbi:hypothetical protein CEXT_749011 [Caerostris extrusa]|uniref:Uncharacterized protein n=1 Tax=Caerostris extrusa TaxID=172846 RepID=A0AAV4Y5V3_CAEEX|nr:hypothetical protein CEXT_749011 [Caerostris extrusa]